MRIRSLVLAGLLSAGVAGAAVAAGPIEARQTIFEGWGDATRPIGAMMKGAAPFDLAKVQAALAAYSDGAAKLPALFPDNSKTGKTEASPKIWQDKAKFEGLFTKLAADSTAAAAAIKDEATFKANMGKVLGNCKACHDDFREKK